MSCSCVLQLHFVLEYMEWWFDEQFRQLLRTHRNLHSYIQDRCQSEDTLYYILVKVKVKVKVKTFIPIKP